MDLIRTIKPLGGEADWPIWRRKIRDLLDYHEGAVDVLDNKIQKPAKLGPTATEAQIKAHKEKSDFFRKANSYAKTMITSSITDAVYQKIMDKDTAYEVWQSLKQQFEATSKDQLFKICTDFFAFKWSNGEDVSTHIASLRSLWHELNQGLVGRSESKLPDLMLVCKTLHILPDVFNSFKSSWMLLTKDEVRSFDELTTQLCMYERNFAKTGRTHEADEEALMVKSGNRKNHWKSRWKSRKDDCCNYCKKKGHWVKDCRKWEADGRPGVRKSGAGTCQSETKALISIFKSDSNRSWSGDWWIDNGATRHVTNNLDYFVNFKKFDSPVSIEAAGKETLEALGSGVIRVISTVNNKRQVIDLTNVWYVPQVSRNLFSVLASQDLNQQSVFKSSPRRCWLYIKGQLTLCGEREIHGTLYKAAIKPILPQDNCKINFAVDDSSMLQVYHERWGHQDKRHVKAMLKRLMDVDVKLNTELCEPCLFGKAHRSPFGTRPKASKPGELISTDVCGPFEESFQKKRYFVVFKDSYTKYRYCAIIKNKSDVKGALEIMLESAKVQGHPVQEIISDNGGEFDNAEVKKILQKFGVTQRLTAPYTPQQNGLSERDNRTIVEMARTFKYANPDAQFPEAIWAELVSSAVYIINRTGKSSVEGVTPFELWTNQKPRIKHLRIIGSRCYAHVPHQKRKKMDMKAVQGYLIGYDGDERYRIYVRAGSKVILSRDVQFKEVPGNCIERVRLPLSLEQKNNPEKEPLQFDPNEEKFEKDDQDDGSDQYDTVPESDNDDEEEEAKSSSNRILRDRASIKRPDYFVSLIGDAEEFIKFNEDPETFQDALKSRNRTEWEEAMSREIQSLEENLTWTLEELPIGAKALPCKWVFKVKTLADGSVDKFKARLVIKGFKQRQGIDYRQTFSPVAKMQTIRSLLSIAASENMHLAQFDVSTAFLYGELEEDIFMHQPEGFEDGSSKVCKLQRSLYGLKQAPRCWNKRFGNFLIKLGFKVSDADPCMFIRERGKEKLILVLYVDDGLVAGTNSQDIQTFLMELRSEFKIVTKEANYFLGLEIEQNENYIKINQTSYAKKILERFNFTGCKPVSTPILKNPEVEEVGKEGKISQFPYRQAVGAIMYLMLGTRPDIAYSIGFVSRSLENPSEEDVVRVKRILRYIAGTINFGIKYKLNFNQGILECYSDADFGGCLKSGRSTSGVVISYAGGAISWLSQRQAMVATSTTEAEIVAANEAAKEIIWLTRLFSGIVKLSGPPILQVDNSAAVRLAQNPEFHRRTKHIAIKHFFIREKISEGKFDIQQISTEKQVADIMTKPLAKFRMKILCDQMGLS